MNTRFLQTLIAVDRHGSMAEVARRLNITHAAVAQQIRTLEALLGIPLISRSGKTVHLTEAARRILETSQKILDHVDTLRVLAHAREIKGELRLGAGHTTLTSVVPNILAALAQYYPALRVTVRTGLSAQFHTWIDRGEIDVAIALEAPFELPKKLVWQQLWEEPFMLLAPARHHATQAHDLLRREAFIRYDRSSWMGNQIDHYLKTVGIAPKEQFELASTESIAQMVHKGLGIAIVPNVWNLWKHGLNVVSLPLPGHCEPRRFGLIWARACPRLQLVEVFAKAATEQCRASVAHT